MWRIADLSRTSRHFRQAPKADIHTFSFFDTLRQRDLLASTQSKRLVYVDHDFLSGLVAGLSFIEREAGEGNDACRNCRKTPLRVP